MNLDITKLSIDELKTFKKFNREFLPKIKKLDFNFADMKKGELMLISTPKDIIKFIKKTPSTKKYNFKDCLLYTSPSPRDLRRSRMPSSA